MSWINIEEHNRTEKSRSNVYQAKRVRNSIKLRQAEVTFIATKY